MSGHSAQEDLGVDMMARIEWRGDNDAGMTRIEWRGDNGAGMARSENDI